MRYGNPYRTQKLSDILINKTLDKVDYNLIKGNVESSTKKIVRNSKISFIKHDEILQQFLEISKNVNQMCDWNFDLDAIEPLQYGEYGKKEEYGWHVDQHNKPYNDGRVRKISFSVFLNNDYTGGEFDLELHSPSVKDRYDTFTILPLNTALFFKSDYWHRVRPVTKGVRKSLVGWVLGPKFK